MSLFCRLTRKHYWCIPHRSENKKLVQVCYECGAERPARELHTEIVPEWINHGIASSTMERATAVPETACEQPSQQATGSEPVGVRQSLFRRFALVK